MNETESEAPELPYWSLVKKGAAPPYPGEWSEAHTVAARIALDPRVFGDPETWSDFHRERWNVALRAATAGFEAGKRAARKLP